MQFVLVVLILTGVQIMLRNRRYLVSRFRSTNKIFLPLSLSICMVLHAISCTERDDLSIHIINPTLSSISVSAFDLIDHVEYIELPEDNSAFFAHIQAGYVDDKHIMIKTIQSNVIYLHDLYGNFLFKISPSGRGPLEYSEITAYVYDEYDDNIIIYDKSLTKILYYSVENRRFIFEKKISPQITSMYATEDYLYCLQRDFTDGFLKIRDKASLEILKEYIFAPDYYDMIPGFRPFINVNNQILLNASFSDTIYAIADLNCTATAVIGQGKTSITTIQNQDELHNKIMTNQKFARSLDNPMMMSYGHLADMGSVVLIITVNEKTILYNTKTFSATSIIVNNIEDYKYFFFKRMRFWYSGQDYIYSYIFRQHIDQIELKKVIAANPLHETPLRNLLYMIEKDPDNENPILVKMKFKDNWDQMFFDK